MTEFAGFEMPLWYKGIIPEHMAVRNAVGIFDVSHMGRVIIEGKDAEKFVNYIVTNDIKEADILGAKYTVMCNENGGIIDDAIVYKLAEDKFLQVFNAANREKDYNWLIKHSKNFEVKIIDLSDEIAMLAIQGPKAVELLNEISIEKLDNLRRFSCKWTEIEEVKVLAARTGYTGEDGFELYLWNTPLENPKNAFKVWSKILEVGKKYGIEACGLGARDSLRLEAGLCLYGNDIDEKTTPLEARLSFVVKFDKGDFIGRESLLKQKAEGVKRVRVGIKMIERGIPRKGYKVYINNELIGVVTSGGFSPLLKCGIAMAYIKKDFANVGEELYVNIRGKRVKGEIVKFPFYDPTKYGYGRLK